MRGGRGRGGGVVRGNCISQVLHLDHRLGHGTMRARRRVQDPSLERAEEGECNWNEMERSGKDGKIKIGFLLIRRRGASIVPGIAPRATQKRGGDLFLFRRQRRGSPSVTFELDYWLKGIQRCIDGGGEEGDEWKHLCCIPSSPVYPRLWSRPGLGTQAGADQ